VTPPAGFEVSQTVGGGSDYAPTQTVGAAGTVPATMIYLRLAAGTPVGTYSGNIVCSSAGATSVNVATVASAVSAFTGEVANFVIISFIVLLSVTLDFVQEYRANAAAVPGPVHQARAPL
jgi:hypothetical protein